MPSSNPLLLDATVPVLPATALSLMGTTNRPDGRVLTVDSQSLLYDRKRWLPVSGEFHYSRYPAEEWRDALLQIKAGGIDIVSTYVFWIHHEEEEGHWNWSGQHDLRRFLTLCGETGLNAVVRCGPWAHGEARNGGFPDWLQNDKKYHLRSTDPAFLAQVQRLYSQIALQLRGLLWKDGGPVVGIQCDNEYGGPAAYLIALKKLAQEAGLDVPLYTRTGWPALSTPMPEGELLPLFGSYAEGFWDRELTPMPGSYNDAFLFLMARDASAAAIGTDQLGKPQKRKGDNVGPYPYFCCEIGGGMASSYHRRIHLTAMDVLSTGLIKVGSGNNLQGYYMYHGGTNPEGKLSTLQESQATHYWNDLPVKTYDFNAPLGEFGQVREHYHRLRLMHLFLRDWGSQLAALPARVPDIVPTDAKDNEVLRWAARTDGGQGFVFVNNYQRLQQMPARKNVQFQIRLHKDPAFRFPIEPITIPANSAFFWPFHLDLGGATLLYATAQPICTVEDGNHRYVVFTETAGVPVEFVLDAHGITIDGKTTGQVTNTSDTIRIQQVKPGTAVAVRLHTDDKKQIHLIVLTEAQSLSCWKGTVAGRERILLTDSDLTLDGNMIRLRGESPVQSVAILPAPSSIRIKDAALSPNADGAFLRFTTPSSSEATLAVKAEVVQQAGPAREIHKGSQGVAEAPTDADFPQAAVWRIRLPDAKNAERDLLLRIPYIGDVARLYLDGKLIADNFYNGLPFELGLKRFSPQIYTGELLLKVLPLRKDAPIYLDKNLDQSALPDYGDAGSALALKTIRIVERQTIPLRIV